MTELPSSADILLIGGGIASASCAQTLRERGFGGSIVLVGRELDPPYDRPPCSKDYLRGKVDRQALALHPSEWYLSHSIELLTRTSVMKLDLEARQVRLSTKHELTFDRALIATGALVRRLPITGAGLEGIHYLRAPGNADTIRRDVAEASSVVLVGGSYIACEVAASLTRMGKRTTLVMVEEEPLSTGFGTDVGRFFGSLLGEHGISMVRGDGVASFETADGATEEGRVGVVVTTSGQRIEADAVIMGTGAQPDVMLARGAGLTLGETGGVRCSATLETSAPGVFAAGDMCEYASVLHDGAQKRVEHWEHAAAQGRAAAAAMLGDDAPFDEVPYFWSDLADWATLEYVGGGDRTWDRAEVRGSFDDGEFSVFYSAGDRVVGALTVGRPDDLDEARSLIRSAATAG